MGTEMDSTGATLELTEPDYLVNRYYDPATGQFLTEDPLANVTDQPFAYADDDPVNNLDPAGLNWLTSTLHTIGHAANVVLRDSPGTKIDEAISTTTGLTIGGCVGGSYFGGPAFTANLCYLVTPSGQTGFSFSVGGGGGGPLGVNALIGLTVSNAKNLNDLAGIFGYGEGSEGKGLYGLGVQGSIGVNSCGQTIWSAEGGWSPGARVPIPGPFTFGGGVTKTWIFGRLG